LEAVRSYAASVGIYLPRCRADCSLDDAVEWTARCRSGWSTENHFAFALFDIASGQLPGSAGLSQHDRLHRRANLAYRVRQSRQRAGVATIAVQHVVRFGFQTLGLQPIEIVVLPRNQASRATAEKSGSTFEGIARQRLLTSGQAKDAAVYGLIPQDLL
jgi:ribosomal-protein-serine acetyltransferase